MMKRFWAALCALLMLCTSFAASAEEITPDRSCFSPGLEEIEAAVLGDGVEINARFAPESMLSANKNALAVLKALFEQASVVYRMNGEQEYAQLMWNDALLADLALVRQEEGAAVASSVLPFPIRAQDEAQLYYTLGMHAGFAQMAADSRFVTPVHFDLPQVSGEAVITQEVVDALSGDLPALTVTQPLTLSWTADEEGFLTKANIDGGVQLEGDAAPWMIDLAAWGGRSKMSVEGTLVRDDDNKLDLAVSITYASNKATRKENAGHDIETRVKLSGKLGGYTKTLSVTLKGSNNWVRAEETGVLEETIKQSVSLTYTDKDPEASKANTSNISLSIKDNGTIVSGGTQEAAQADFKTTVLIEIGQYTLLEGTLYANMRALNAEEPVMEEALLASLTPQAATAGEATADEAEIALVELNELNEEQLFELREVMDERIAALMHTMYPTLDQATYKKIKNDLE